MGSALEYPARPGVGRVMFDRYSQGAGSYSLQTKGVSAVKLCLGKRKKKKKTNLMSKIL